MNVEYWGMSVKKKKPTNGRAGQPQAKQRQIQIKKQKNTFLTVVTRELPGTRFEC